MRSWRQIAERQSLSPSPPPDLAQPLSVTCTFHPGTFPASPASISCPSSSVFSAFDWAASFRGRRKSEFSVSDQVFSDPGYQGRLRLTNPQRSGCGTALNFVLPPCSGSHSPWGPLVQQIKIECIMFKSALSRFFRRLIGSSSGYRVPLSFGRGNGILGISRSPSIQV
jgi:hypothetical protein